jgi:hypothetical protein
MTTLATPRAMRGERTEDARLMLELARIVARPALSLGTIVYGTLRLLSVHYPPGDPVAWIHRFGELPPTVFLSMWMGVSPVSETIASFAIIIGGALVALTRTTTLGALILLGTMGNELMLKYGFGSNSAEMHRAMTPPLIILALACFLVLLDIRRIVRVLISRRVTVPPMRSSIWFDNPWLKRLEKGTWIVAVVTALAIVWPAAYDRMDRTHTSPLRGVYRVESFTMNGDSMKVRDTAAKRWRLVAIDNYARNILVRTIDDTRNELLVFMDARENMSNGWRARRAAITSSPSGSFLVQPPTTTPTFGVAESASEVRYVRSGDKLTLEGDVNGVQIKATMRRVPDREFKIVRWSLL